jgi:phospholipid N-methyltransferase
MYDVEQALKDGVPEEEIVRYLSRTRNYRLDDAVKAGVPYKEIIDFLAPQKSFVAKPVAEEALLKPTLKKSPTPLVPERTISPITPPGLLSPDLVKPAGRPKPSLVAPEIAPETPTQPRVDLSEFPKEEPIPSHKPVKPTPGVPAAEPTEEFGLRPGGTPKGKGFLGILRRPGGGVSTEISVGVNIDGQEVQIPSLVPTLDPTEKDYLLSTPASPEMWKTPMGQQIMVKAIDHAKKRMAVGKSPFAQEGEQTAPIKAQTTKPSILAPAMETVKNLATVYGPVEAAANLASQIYGLPTVGLAQVAGLPFGKSQEFGEKAAKATIYEPRTEAGKQVTEAASYPFKLLDIAGEKAAEVTREKIGSPAAATVVGTAIKAAPLLLGLKGPLKSIGKSVLDSGWYRGLTVKERGLVTQSLEDMINRGYSEGEVLKRWNNPSWREEALRRRNKGEEYPPFTEAGKPTEPAGPRITPPGLAPEVPEPIGSMIPAGTPAPSPTTKMGNELPTALPRGQRFQSTGPKPEKISGAKPPIEMPEPIGTTLPTGISPIAPSPRPAVPVKAPQPIPPMGVGPIAQWPQPSATLAPATPIPPMMGMGQAAPAPLPEERPPTFEEAVAESEAKTAEVRRVAERFAQPQEATAAPEAPPEVMAQPITEVRPVLEKPVISRPPEPQITPRGDEPLKRGLSYEEWSKDPALVEDADAAAATAGVKPEDLEYMGLQSFKPASADAYHLWNVMNPESPLYKSTVAGPKFQEEPATPPGEKTKQPWEMTREEFKLPPESAYVKSAEGNVYRANSHPEAYIKLEKAGDTESDIPRNRGWVVSDKLIRDSEANHATLHKEFIKQALSEGKPVPSEVLAEYPELQTTAEQAIPPTAQHLELMPEEYPNIESVAVEQDGKVYKDHTHVNILLENNLDPEKAVPGFLTKQGEFVEQYPESKAKAEKLVPELAKPSEPATMEPVTGKKGKGEFPTVETPKPVGGKNTSPKTIVDVFDKGIEYAKGLSDEEIRKLEYGILYYDFKAAGRKATPEDRMVSKYLWERLKFANKNPAGSVQEYQQFEADRKVIKSLSKKENLSPQEGAILYEAEIRNEMYKHPPKPSQEALVDEIKKGNIYNTADDEGFNYRGWYIWKWNRNVMELEDLKTGTKISFPKDSEVIKKIKESDESIESIIKPLPKPSTPAGEAGAASVEIPSKELPPSEKAPAITQMRETSKGEPGPSETKSGNWQKGESRPFAFDPNSTENEGRFRLYPPGDIKKETYKSQTAIKSKSIEPTEGVRFILGDTKDGKRVIQTIRFDKSVMPEEKATQWWEENKRKFEFAEEKPKEVTLEGEKGSQKEGAIVRPEENAPNALTHNREGTGQRISERREGMQILGQGGKGGKEEKETRDEEALAKILNREVHKEGEKPSASVVRPEVATKLRQSAESLTNQIQEKRNPAVAQQNVTARRANQTASVYEEANRLENLQNKLNALADAHEGGTVPESLQGITTRPQAENILRHSKYPRAYLHRVWIQDILNATKGKPGTAQDREILSRVMGREENGGSLHGEKEITAADSLIKIAEKAGEKSPWARESIAEHKRMLAAGIDTEEKFAQAKTDLNELGKKPIDRSKEQKIRTAEQNLLGRKIPGYFPTPKATAERLVEEAEIQPGMSVLEPSAGKGNIADVIKEKAPDADLKTIEWQGELADILRLKGHEVIGSDFLEHQGKYDRIVMNPPFEKFQDIDHVRHAYEHLNPGGRVVSIMSESPFFRSDKKAVEFREWLDSMGGTSEKLPEKSFSQKSERATGVTSRIVIIDKPSEAKVKKVSPVYAAIPLALPFLMGKGEENKRKSYPWKPEAPSYLPPGMGRQGKENR